MSYLITIIIIKLTFRVKALSLLPDVRVGMRVFCATNTRNVCVYFGTFCARGKSCAVEGLACEKDPAVEKRRESVTTRCLQIYVYSVSSEFKLASKHV